MNKNYKNLYPRIVSLNIPIHCESNIDHCLGKEIEDVLIKNKLPVGKFNVLFGVQTAMVRKDGQIGSYAWDVESVLERMIGGKLTGSQLNWD